MKVNKFIKTLRYDLGCDYDDLILQWLEFNANLAEDDEIDLEAELDDTARALCYVKNNFDEETLRKTLTYPTLANEVISCAVLFKASQSIEVVNDYAESGRIEGGYIPKTFDEKGSLSLVYCAGEDDSVFVCHDIPMDELKDMVEQTFYTAKEIGSTAGTLLENLSRTDNRIHCFGRDVIGVHMLNIFNLDEKCSAFGCRIRCLPNIEAITAGKHPTLIAAEQEANEYGVIYDTDEQDWSESSDPVISM